MGKVDADRLLLSGRMGKLPEGNQTLTDRHDGRYHIVQVELYGLSTFALAGVFDIESYSVSVFVKVQIAELEAGVADAFTECKEWRCRKVAVFAAVPAG